MLCVFLALAALVTCEASSARPFYRPLPAVGSCAATGERCGMDVACASLDDVCIPTSEHGGVCSPAGNPSKKLGTRCNASLPLPCGLGLECREGVCAITTSGRAGDSCSSDANCTGADNACGVSTRVCEGIPAGKSCRGAERSCAPGLWCNRTREADTCQPRLSAWTACSSDALPPPSLFELAGDTAIIDPCARGSFCAAVSRAAGEPARAPSVCVPLGVYGVGATLDVVPYRPTPWKLARRPRRPERPNVSTPTAGTDIRCSSGVSGPVAHNASHDRIACLDPVPALYLTNEVGKECVVGARDAPPPYHCVPEGDIGPGRSHSSKGVLVAPWTVRDDAAAAVQALAMCRVGTDGNGSETGALPGCSRESSPSAPGSCAYYACFDHRSVTDCLATGLIWDKATYLQFKPSLPTCFDDQVHLNTDVFACVWGAEHQANCSSLGGAGDPAGACPYRPRPGLSDGERDGITIALVMAGVCVITVSVAGFALSGTRGKQRAERARAWRHGGLALGPDTQGDAAAGVYVPMTGGDASIQAGEPS